MISIDKIILRTVYKMNVDESVKIFFEGIVRVLNGIRKNKLTQKRLLKNVFNKKEPNSSFVCRPSKCYVRM